MIPYIEWKTIALGPLTLQVWGLFVGLGFLLGAGMAGRLAKRRGQDPKVIYDLAVWMVVAGMVGGRLGHVLLYEFSYYVAHPLEAFAIWEGGLSMFGGLLACAGVGLWYLRKKQVDVWAYADTAVFGLPFGFMLGRIGCFLIHDHPGTATDFALGVPYPDGVVRHDLALYEIINAMVMAAVFLFGARKKWPIGHFLRAFIIWYGVFRLVTDEFRAVDTTYFGFTPGQYFGLVFVLVGLLAPMWITRMRKKRSVVE